MIRTPLKPLGLALACCLPLLAHAQLAGNIGLTSNYKFRGQDQDGSKSNMFKPALQGGVDYAFANSGLYLGNWNSTVDWLPGNHLEVDVYGGYKFKAGPVDLDFGMIGYLYPGNHSGNTTEAYGAATFGPVTVKYAHTLSKDYFGFAGAGRRGRNTGYLNLAFEQPVADKIKLKAALGFTRFARAIAAPDYVDYSLGGVYDLGSGLALGAALAGGTKQSELGFVNKPRLLVTLSKTL